MRELPICILVGHRETSFSRKRFLFDEWSPKKFRIAEVEEKVRDLLLFENLAVTYFMLTVLLFAVKFSKEQRILGLRSEVVEKVRDSLEIVTAKTRKDN